MSLPNKSTRCPTFILIRLQHTRRVVVNLPNGVKSLHRLNPDTPLIETFRRVCFEKNLDPSQFEVQLTDHPKTAVDMSLTLNDYQASELTIRQCSGKKSICLQFLCVCRIHISYTTSAVTVSDVSTSDHGCFLIKLPQWSSRSTLYCIYLLIMNPCFLTSSVGEIQLWWILYVDHLHVCLLLNGFEYISITSVTGLFEHSFAIDTQSLYVWSESKLNS